MQHSVIYYIFVAILLSLYIGNNALECACSECCSSDEAQCKPLRVCPSLVKKLANIADSKNHNAIIRQNVCSIGQDGEIYVCCPSLPTDCGTRPPSNRIHKGTVTKPREFPWIVAIGYTSSSLIDGSILYACGGSVISKRYLLTAAHCVADGDLKNKEYTLSHFNLGDWDVSRERDRICKKKRNNKPKCRMFKPHLVAGFEKIIVHPDYNNITVINDIALIRLNITIDFSSSKHEPISPICLPRKGAPIKSKKAIAAGWGYNHHNEKPNKLNKAPLRLLDSSECIKYFKGNFTDKQICTGSINGKDSCWGDSGGPLMITGDGGTPFYIHGIDSYDYGDCGDEYPGVGTYVTKYLDWIEENMEL